MEDFDTFDRNLLSKNSKIIHQIWFGSIPNRWSAKKEYAKLSYYRESWIEKNPEWFRVEWNKDMCKKLVATCFPEHAELFSRFQYEIQRCDTIRYLILYRYGGLYVDMDYYCNRPFDEALKEYTNNIYLVQSPNGTVFQDSDHVSNSLMYSEKEHPFWKILMLEIEKSEKAPLFYTKHLIVMFTTGPGIVNRVYSKYKYRYKTKSFPYELFHPYGITSEIRTTKLDPKIFAVHISKGKWSTKDTAFLNTIAREWKVLIFVFLGLLLPLILSRKTK